jgi:hypothetical protein
MADPGPVGHPFKGSAPGFCDQRPANKIPKGIMNIMRRNGDSYPIYVRDCQNNDPTQA